MALHQTGTKPLPVLRMTQLTDTLTSGAKFDQFHAKLLQKWLIWWHFLLSRDWFWPIFRSQGHDFGPRSPWPWVWLRKPGPHTQVKIFWSTPQDWHIHVCITRLQWVNSLWPSDVIATQNWLNISPGTSCCLRVPSHYLYLCWLIIKGVLLHSPERNFTRSAQELNPHVFQD